MRPPLTSRLLLLLASALLLAGCGSPREVTYVDPNGPDTGARNGGEPVVEHGTAAMERARAFVRIRAGLTAARTLSGTDRVAAARAIEQAIERDLPLVEARIASADPAAARELRRSLERLRDAPPRDVAGYTQEIRRVSDSLLVQASEQVIPASARQDVGFRAALLHESLLEAATSYESAFDDRGDRLIDADAYRLAYGLLIDAATRQLEAIPEASRPSVRARLDRVSRSATPGPTPPESPRDPEDVLGELSTIADDVARTAAIDPTFPEPDPATPDQLRALKRSVAASVEAWERGERENAVRQLTAADRSSLQLAASGVASVSPTVLADIERGLVLDLPDAMRRGTDVATVAVDVDASIDEAIALVEEELKLLRDSG